MKVKLNNSTGVTKEAKIGFSWTTFFFGCLPALFRGDLKWAAIMFIVGLILGSFTFGLGAWASFLVFSFIYNKLYIKDLLEKGYRPADEHAKTQLTAAGIITGDVTEVA